MVLSKKGDVAWQTIAVIILSLVVLVVLIIFSSTLKEKMVEGLHYFLSNILGR